MTLQARTQQALNEGRAVLGTKNTESASSKAMRTQLELLGEWLRLPSVTVTSGPNQPQTVVTELTPTPSGFVAAPVPKRQKRGKP